MAAFFKMSFSSRRLAISPRSLPGLVFDSSDSGSVSRIGVRRSQIGTGERSEKIRTYNYPQNRVTDHRLGQSKYNLPGVMDGEITSFIEELSTRDEAGRLATAGTIEDEE